LRHEYNGVELKVDEARDTLSNLQYIWKRLPMDTPCCSLSMEQNTLNKQ